MPPLNLHLNNDYNNQLRDIDNYFNERDGDEPGQMSFPKPASDLDMGRSSLNEVDINESNQKFRKSDLRRVKNDKGKLNSFLY